MLKIKKFVIGQVFGMQFLTLRHCASVAKLEREFGLPFKFYKKTDKKTRTEFFL